MFQGVEMLIELAPVLEELPTLLTSKIVTGISVNFQIFWSCERATAVLTWKNMLRFVVLFEGFMSKKHLSIAVPTNVLLVTQCIMILLMLFRGQ